MMLTSNSSGPGGRKKVLDLGCHSPMLSRRKETGNMSFPLHSPSGTSPSCIPWETLGQVVSGLTRSSVRVLETGYRKCTAAFLSAHWVCVEETGESETLSLVEEGLHP
jgi:hypothetical protein